MNMNFQGIRYGNFVVEFVNNKKMRIIGFKIIDNERLLMVITKNKIQVVSRRIIRRIVKPQTAGVA